MIRQCYNERVTVPEARANAQLRRYDPRSLRVPFGSSSLRLVVPAAREFLRRGDWARSERRSRRADGRGSWVGPEHESADWEPPYWVEVWPSARAVVWALARWCGAATEGRAGDAEAGGGGSSGAPLRELRVLDLGCGLGVPGIAAARCGARVLFQDRSPDALAFALWNARRVTAETSAVAGVDGAWCDSSTVDRTLEELGLLGGSVKGRSGGFDLIVLADVSYHVPVHDALLRFVDSVAGPATVVLHADPERADSTSFLERLPSAWEQFEAGRMVQHEDRTTRVRLVVAGQGSDRRDALVAAIGAESRAAAEPRVREGGKTE